MPSRKPAPAAQTEALSTGIGGLNKRRSTWKTLMQQRQLIYMSVPFICLLILFNYVPLWGWIMSFQNYKVAKGIFHSPFIGFDNFIKLFQDPHFAGVLRNTLVMSVMNLAVGFVGAIILALLLYEIKFTPFKRIVQTITYIPHFVSWVVIANIVLTFLSPDGGLVNVLLLKLGIINEPIYFMSQGPLFWIIHTLVSFWKEIGWNTIIYLAVLAGINPDQYEAADTEGANRWQKMIYISLPNLLPTATILLILSVGWIIQSGYESQYLLGNPMVIEYSQVLDLYALDYSFNIGNYSYGAAIGVFKSLVSILLVFSVNKLAQKTSSMRVI